MNKKLKISLISAGAILVTGSICFGAIFLFAAASVNDFRGRASKQLSAAIEGNDENSDAVSLADIPFGGANPQYKNTARLEKTYADLLADVRHYVAITKFQARLTDCYNQNSDPDAALSADILALANDYAAAMKNYFSDSKPQFRALKNLADKIAASTQFSEVSAAMDHTLAAGSDWLDAEKVSLNARTKMFESAINQ